MLDKTSNTSRLVDKLIDKNLVNRTFCLNDRRQVEIRITEEGLQLLHICNEVIEHNIYETMNNLTDLQASHLNELLEIVRNGNHFSEQPID
jgi:DNA-binding MarR family transcriptional regulator